MSQVQFLTSALLLAALLSGGAAWAVRWVPEGGRRPVVLVALSLPVFVLTLATAHTVPRYWSSCVVLAGWDLLISSGLLAVQWGSVVVALSANLVRLRTARRLVYACTPLEEGELVQQVADLCRHLRLPAPRLYVLEVPSPVAATGWGRSPVVVVSRWLLENLDGDELEAALAHELAHLARRAPQALWVARVLRDATWYLPWSWYLLGVLEAEEELEADARAAEATGRPLSLASALGRVTEHALRAAAPLPGFTSGPERVVEERLRRLLDGQARPRHGVAGSLVAGGLAVAVVRTVPPVLATAAAAVPVYCRIGPV